MTGRVEREAGTLTEHWLSQLGWGLFVSQPVTVEPGDVTGCRRGGMQLGYRSAWDNYDKWTQASAICNHLQPGPKVNTANINTGARLA